MSNKRIIRVRLKQDPSVEVVVNTTEDNLPAKLRSIYKDISYQKFPRWAPFANQPMAHSGIDHGWYYKIEGENMHYVRPDPVMVSVDSEASNPTMVKLNAIARDSGFQDLKDMRNAMTERAYAAKMVDMMRIINNGN